LAPEEATEERAELLICGRELGAEEEERQR
jgi:hypothetical protein